MGNTCRPSQLCSSNKNSFIVVTLNYGGVLKSPFEFYSEEEQEERQLSEIYCKLLPLYIKGFDKEGFEWDVGQIDKRLQEKRYSVLYNESVGVDNGKNRLISAKEFDGLWEDHYSANKAKIQPSPTKQQKANMKLFDLICYHTILCHIYPIPLTSKLQSIDISHHNPTSLKTYMHRKFTKSYLNQQKKIEKVISSLIKHKADIMFFQQPTQAFIKKLKQDQNLYVKDTGVNGSMVVVRISKFKTEGKGLQLKDYQELGLQKSDFVLEGNKDLAVLVVNQFLMISAHLSSKKEKNQGEVKALKQLLNKLHKEVPNYDIILGSDANSFISTQSLHPSYSIYPHESSLITTRKKRSYLQPQYKKSQKTIEQCKDHIITQLSIRHQLIQTIDSKKVKGKELLPTDKHPFDHFMVVVEVVKE